MKADFLTRLKAATIGELSFTPGLIFLFVFLVHSFIVIENQFFRVLHNLDAIRGRRLELPLTLEGEGFEARSAEVEAQPRR